MAYTSGTAANYKDLLAIMATFAAANGWAVLEQSETKLYLRGEGSAGVDEIYCGISAYENSVSGYYNWELFGAWTYRAGRAFSAMPRSASGVYVYLWNAPITYWMVATPRRIIMVAKIGTVYQTMHLGFIEPIGTAAQYPYPLFIGGSGSVSTQNYSATGDNNRSFWSDSSITCGKLSTPGGYWQNVNSSTIKSYSASTELRGSIISGLDGTYLLEQEFLTDNNQSSTYGAIDGLFQVSGYNNSSENIVSYGGINYMVFQDVYRVSVGDYCALRMN